MTKKSQIPVAGISLVLVFVAIVGGAMYASYLEHREGVAFLGRYETLNYESDEAYVSEAADEAAHWIQKCHAKRRFGPSGELCWAALELHDATVPRWHLYHGDPEPFLRHVGSPALSITKRDLRALLEAAPRDERALALIAKYGDDEPAARAAMGLVVNGNFSFLCAAVNAYHGMGRYEDAYTLAVVKAITGGDPLPGHTHHHTACHHELQYEGRGEFERGYMPEDLAQFRARARSLAEVVRDLRRHGFQHPGPLHAEQLPLETLVPALHQEIDVIKLKQVAQQ